MDRSSARRVNERVCRGTYLDGIELEIAQFLGCKESR